MHVCVDDNIVLPGLSIKMAISSVLNTFVAKRWQYLLQVMFYISAAKQQTLFMQQEQSIYYDDVTMGGMASLITSLTIVYSTVYSNADQRKDQSSASLAFVWGIHRGPVNSTHKWPVTRKMFPFDDIIMYGF